MSYHDKIDEKPAQAPESGSHGNSEYASKISLVSLFDIMAGDIWSRDSGSATPDAAAINGEKQKDQQTQDSNNDHDKKKKEDGEIVKRFEELLTGVNVPSASILYTSGQAARPQEGKQDSACLHRNNRARTPARPQELSVEHRRMKCREDEEEERSPR